MPKLAGVNLLGWLLAALAIYIITFIWYPLLFMPVYQATESLTGADFEGQSPLWMIFAIITPMILSFGIGWILKEVRAESLTKAVIVGAVVGIFIGGGVQSYDYFYRPEHYLAGLIMHSGSHVITLIVAAMIHWQFGRKDYA